MPTSVPTLPLDVLRYLFHWLPGRDAAAGRTVSKTWNRVLKSGYVTVCCVHRYSKKVMECKVVYCTANETVADVLHDYGAKDTLYYFPHCRPAVYCGGGCDDEREAQASPTEMLAGDTKVKDLLIHRLLVSDKCAHDSFVDIGSFENYMQLLLKLQVKHQEYVFEHHARIRLLRTYISNLEHRVGCKLKLLVEQLGFLCIRHMVVLLPQLETAIRRRQELRSAAVKIQLAKYRVLQEKVEQERHGIEECYHAPIFFFDMKGLEEYSAFLCRADDVLEKHMEACRADQSGLDAQGAGGARPDGGHGAPWLANTRLPNDCRFQSGGDDGGGGAGQPQGDADADAEADGNDDTDLPASHIDGLRQTIVHQSDLEDTLRAILTVRAEQLTYRGTSPHPIHLTSSSAVPQRSLAALTAASSAKPATVATHTQTEQQGQQDKMQVPAPAAAAPPPAPVAAPQTTAPAAAAASSTAQHHTQQPPPAAAPAPAGPSLLSAAGAPPSSLPLPPRLQASSSSEAPRPVASASVSAPPPSSAASTSRDALTTLTDLQRVLRLAAAREALAKAQAAHAAELARVRDRNRNTDHRDAQPPPPHAAAPVAAVPSSSVPSSSAYPPQPAVAPHPSASSARAAPAASLLRKATAPGPRAAAVPVRAASASSSAAAPTAHPPALGALLSRAATVSERAATPAVATSLPALPRVGASASASASASTPTASTTGHVPATVTVPGASPSSRPAVSAATIQELQKALSRLSAAAQAVQTHAARHLAAQQAVAEATASARPASATTAAPAARPTASPQASASSSVPPPPPVQADTPSSLPPPTETAVLQAMLARLKTAQQQQQQQ